MSAGLLKTNEPQESVSAIGVLIDLVTATSFVPGQASVLQLFVLFQSPLPPTQVTVAAASDRKINTNA